MLSSPSLRSMQRDNGLFHTGIFLRPRVATSLQGLIRNKTIQDRAKFTVAKSQIHPNGLCEIVVKRQDPTIPTNSIMDLLERCRQLVEEHIVPHDKGSKSDLNRTIELSDNDDSICILSPSPSSGRQISFKRTLSIDSPSSIKILSPNQLIEPLHKRQNLVINVQSQPTSSSTIDYFQPLHKKENLIINVNSQPSSAYQDRKVLLQSNDGANDQHSPKQPNLCSPVTSMKGEKLRVKALNDCASSSSSQCDAASSSVVLLDVSEDALPSAPTWTTSLGSIFPLNSISQNLGKNLATENSIGEKDQNKLASKNEISNPGINLIRRFSDVVKENYKPKVLDPVENLSTSKYLLVPGKESRNFDVGSIPLQRDFDVCSIPLPRDFDVCSIPLPREEERDSTDIMQTSGTSEQNTAVTTEDGQLKQDTRESEQKADTPVNGVERCQNNTQSVDRPSSSASGEMSSDDEIIIEKELKGTNNPPSLIIDDSDDDIAVCEVINNTQVINEPMLSKNQKKKQKKLFQKQAISVPSSSTSSGPAPDFIPLFDSSHHRWRHNPPNQPLTNKAAKFKKMQEKKERKARAVLHNSIQSRKVDSSSGKKQSLSPENKEKKEFGNNIINPNPETSKTGLRPVVIDASNVAIGHGRGPFSVRGLKICVKYFTDRGHKVIAFAPKFRRFHVSPEDRKAMDELETQGILSYTPSRTLESGRKLASYDDRYIVQVAAELGGVIISTDNYRDLLSENEAWRETIEQRLLMFTWVGDMLLFPNDPLGRDGPHLQDFLRFPDSQAKK